MANNQIPNMTPSFSRHQEDFLGLSLQQHRFADIDKILPHLRYMFIHRFSFVLNTHEKYSDVCLLNKALVGTPPGQRSASSASLAQELTVEDIAAMRLLQKGSGTLSVHKGSQSDR